MVHEPPHIPLPKSWPEVVHLAVVHVIGLAHASLTVARGWCADSPIRRVQLVADNDRLRSKVALLEKELDILRARQSRQPAAGRSHYTPIERLQILQVKAARAWNNSQCARRFLLAPSTIAEWQARLDQEGSSDFFRLRVPVNRYTDLTATIVQDLKALFPNMGKQQMANVLARAALHLSGSTIGRMLKRPRQKTPPPRAKEPPTRTDQPGAEAPQADKPQRTVTAKAPNHLWHVDITVVPTTGGFWVPWWPFSLPTLWPFSWHVGVVMDHFSRRLLAMGVFPKEPSEAQMCALLERAVERAGATPKHIVSDKGCQFFGRDEDTQYQLWCKQRGIRMRFGAVGKKGSIVVIERFMLTLKSEYLRRILVALSLPAFARQLEAFGSWYNTHRPHSALGGCTPDEVFFGKVPARTLPRLEPRRCFPLRTPPSRAAPAAVHGKRGVVLQLVVEHHHDQPTLPVVSLRRAA